MDKPPVNDKELIEKLETALVQLDQSVRIVSFPHRLGLFLVGMFLGYILGVAFS